MLGFLQGQKVDAFNFMRLILQPLIHGYLAKNSSCFLSVNCESNIFILVFETVNQLLGLG